MKVVLFIQVITFVVLGVYYLTVNQWRLGVAQLLLAAVQAVIYSEGFS
jgi:hypothetical protein